MGVPFIQARDPLTPLLQQAFSGTGQAVGEGIFKQRKASELDRIIKEATDPEGAVDNQQIAQQLAASSLFGLEESQKFSKQTGDAARGDRGLDLQERKIAGDEAERELKLEQEKTKQLTKQISLDNSEKLFDSFDKGDINANQLLGASQGIKDPEVRKAMETTARTLLTNKARVDESAAGARETVRLNNINKDLEKAQERATIATNTINALDAAEPLFSQITSFDKGLSVLAENGTISDTTANFFKSAQSQSLEAVRKTLVANKAKILGGSNPSSVQTKFIVDATLNADRPEEANRSIAEMDRFSALFDIEAKDIKQRDFEKNTRGEFISKVDTDKEIEVARQRLLNEYIIRLGEINDPEFLNEDSKTSRKIALEKARRGR